MSSTRSAAISQASLRPGSPRIAARDSAAVRVGARRSGLLRTVVRMPAGGAWRAALAAVALLLGCLGVAPIASAAGWVPQRTLSFSGLSYPAGVAVDGAGDVFTLDTNGTRVVELTAGGTQKVLPFSGLTNPYGVAVDGAGDVFVSDTYPERIVELTAGGTQRTLPFSGLSNTSGVAVDGSGDVFVSDTSNNRIVELTAGGTQTTLPFSGLRYPEALAVDGSGDVFVADTDSSRIVELAQLGPASAAKSTISASPLMAPRRRRSRSGRRMRTAIVRPRAVTRSP